MVYEPREDSVLLLNATIKEIDLIRQTTKRLRFLDIGTGSGFIAENIARCYNKRYNNKRYNNLINITATDINQEALEQCKKRLKSIKAKIRVKIIKSDLFNNIKGKFHIITFNAPYLPKGMKSVYNAGQDTSSEVIGGKHGYEIISRFLDQLPEYLHKKGVCLITYSSLSKPMIIEQKARNKLLDINIVSSKKMFFETLFVAKITKSKLLQQINNEGIRHVNLLSKGKHSLVYKAVSIKKRCYKERTDKTSNKQSKLTVAIKVALKGFENNIRKEFKVLQYLNNFNKVSKHKEIHIPRVYNCKKNWFEMDFIKGVNLNDFLELSAKQGFKSKKLVMDVLIKILKTCYILDLEHIIKEEMHRPNKHIIIVNTDNTDSGLYPYFIDFERCHKGKPHNVTQFCQYLTTKHVSKNLELVGISIDKQSMIHACKQYKKHLTKHNFEDILGLISPG